MNSSFQESLPLYTSEIYDQAIDLPVERPVQILVLEKEYLELIRSLMKRNPELNRMRLSKEVCRMLQWLKADGKLKDMSCRVAMLRMHKDRFAGTCYRAANWINVGQTKGRGELGPPGEISAPIKDIWVYPLVKKFRVVLKN